MSTISRPRSRPTGWRGSPDSARNSKTRSNNRSNAARTKKTRRLLIDVDPTALDLQTYLRAIPGVLEANVAGSWRRRRETVGDLDAVAAENNDPAKAVDAFTEWPPIAEIVSHGDTRSSVVLHNGLAVDFRAVKPSTTAPP